MKIGIYSNLTRDIGGTATKAVLKILLEKRHDVFFSEELRQLNLDIPCLDKLALAQMVDVMIVFGGDGTLLGIAKECAQCNTKIFAVNVGHMGFLTEVENVDLQDYIAEIEQGNYLIDRRCMLQLTVKNKKYIALNEVVFERNRQTKLLKCAVSVSGKLLNNYNSDGIIVSTPTGSTAYSLSAGGPILAPDVKAFVITPICAHSLNAIPIVISDNKAVEVKLLHASLAHISVDGSEILQTSTAIKAKIKKSPLKVSFLRLKEYNYYEKLLSKMYFLNTQNSNEE